MSSETDQDFGNIDPAVRELAKEVSLLLAQESLMIFHKVNPYDPDVDQVSSIIEQARSLYKDYMPTVVRQATLWVGKIDRIRYTQTSKN